MTREVVLTPESSRMILAAEGLRFDAPQVDEFGPLLRQYIDHNYLSEQDEVRIAVASAVRQYIALLTPAAFPAVAVLLQAERKAPPSFEMEVVKMVTRKLSATLPEPTSALRALEDQLLDLATTYATPRMLPKRYCGAVALDSILSLALLRSSHLPGLTARLKSIPVGWFRVTVARQALALCADLARRFGSERCGPVSECLGALAGPPGVRTGVRTPG